MNTKTIFTASLIAFLVISCNVDQTEKTELPDVDVNVEDGNLPEYDVDWADVDMGTKTKTVKVPKVVVVMEEEEVEVPYLDVNMAEEYGENEERTIMVEAEVDDVEHELNIEKIYAKNNQLIVISKLEKKDQDLGDKKLRISDRIEINAPDLNVKHIIVGEKPNRVFNNSYKYVASEKEAMRKYEDYEEIYSD